MKKQTFFYINTFIIKASKENLLKIYAALHINFRINYKSQALQYLKSELIRKFSYYNSNYL